MTTKRRGMTEEAADAAIDQACRMLRMPTIRNSFTDYADRAGREQMSYRGFLAELLLAECDDRARRRSERRIKAAKFPREKSLRAFDFDANPNIDPAVIHTLAKCEWVQKGQPLCLIGDSGTGKSHLLIALGTEAAMAGYRVKYTLATQLANELVEAADEMTLAKTIARYGRVDLLCIDELGYMQFDRRGAELLFQVLTEREEKASVAIASNESFGGWTKTFTDPRLCAAIVDRLTFGGTILETGTDSYRLAQATKQRTMRPTASGGFGDRAPGVYLACRTSQRGPAGSAVCRCRSCAWPRRWGRRNEGRRFIGCGVLPGHPGRHVISVGRNEADGVRRLQCADRGWLIDPALGIAMRADSVRRLQEDALHVPEALVRVVAMRGDRLRRLTGR